MTMAISEDAKRRSMDAISHPETQTHLRLFRGSASPSAPALATPAPSASPGVTPQTIKRMAMNAITNVQTVAQIGTLRLTGIIGVYVAHIRQVDQQPKRERQRDILPRPFSAARHTYERE
jgi:hypothetical protein